MGIHSTRNIALVTGAAGFLGSHLVDRLLDEGYDVVGLDNLMTGDLENLSHAMRDPHFHFQVGDVRDKMTVYAQIVFNFACPASPPHYQRDPYATLTTSVLGTRQLVDMARKNNCTIVHASTSEVYGDPLIHPQPESYWGHVNPTGQRACYDEGKRCAEAVLSDAKRMWNVDARVVRIFNTYGPRMAFDDGRVVSNFIFQSLNGTPITIYGEGEQTRSFCYVDDLVEGIIRVSRLEKLTDVLNIGNPEEFTIQELSGVVQQLTGSRCRIDKQPLPSDDPRQRCPDISRAEALIDFRPQTTLREGLKKTIADFKRRMFAKGILRQRRRARAAEAGHHLR